MDTNAPRRSRAAMVARCLGAGVGVLVVLASADLLRAASGEQRILAVADQLQVPASWALKDGRYQSSQGPTPICFGGNPCPSAHRQWHAPGELGTADFTALITSSGWDLTLGRDCEPRARGMEVVRTCEATGQVESYQVVLDYEGSSADQGTGSLSLSLRR